MEKNSEVARVSGVADRLSELPDDILIHNILSLLPMKEAARTCILARRWMFMPLYLLNLDFDASKKVAAASKYAEWVDQLIGSYLGKGVEVLELDGDHIWWDKPPCKVPLLGPAKLPNLKLLKSLTLGCLDIASDALEHFLLGCQSLVRLQLHDLESLTYVNVSGPISRLKSIHISRCDTLQSITVSAPTPDLVSFIYPGGVSHLQIEHAPRLVDLTIGTLGDPSSSYNLLSHPLFHYIAQLETLHLTILNWHKVKHWLPHLRSLSRLKCLGLELIGFRDPAVWPEKLQGVASLIKAATCVQHLLLEVPFQEVKITEEFANLHLGHLRVIELTGFRGRGVDYVLASHLIECAAASASPLKKLIIDFRDTMLVGCPIGEYWDSKSKIEKMKSHAKTRLEQQLPPTAELVLI